MRTLNSEELKLVYGGGTSGGDGCNRGSKSKASRSNSSKSRSKSKSKSHHDNGHHHGPCH